MKKQIKGNLAEELTTFLKELSGSKNKDDLRKRANRLIDSVSPLDLAQAQSNLKQSGVNPQKIQQLSTLFIMMGLAEKEKSDLRLRLPDYHILRKVMAEHEVIRCFLADLEEVADRISHTPHLTSTSIEMMRLSHIAEHLSSLEEHIGREDDVLFPALRDRGWKSLLKPIESEHKYVQMAIDDLIKLIVVFDTIPLNNFKIKLMSTVRYLCPLLREHIFHEDRVLFPLAISTMDDEDLWEQLRHICNDIGYCGIHL